jgi:hypothetical protein
MEVHEGIVELELKYCERCGGLWLRVRGKDNVYCTTCALQIAELPISAPRNATRKPVKRQVICDRPFQVTSRRGGNA